MDERDEIDELVDYELELPQCSVPWGQQLQCEKCGNDWHGLPKGSCKGLG